MRKTTQKNKHCPFIDEKCLKAQCSLYDEAFERCIIGLATYNLFKLYSTIQAQLDSERK